MKSKLLTLILFSGFFLPNTLFAQDLIKIEKKSIPLVQGAVLEEKSTAFQNRSIVKAKINKYSVDMSAKEVIDFYHSYFQNNAWFILGGISGQDTYNAMLKRDSVQFTILIHPDENEAGKTYIEFIW